MDEKKAASRARGSSAPRDGRIHRSVSRAGATGAGESRARAQLRSALERASRVRPKFARAPAAPPRRRCTQMRHVRSAYSRRERVPRARQRAAHPKVQAARRRARDATRRTGIDQSQSAQRAARLKRRATRARAPRHIYALEARIFDSSMRFTIFCSSMMKARTMRSRTAVADRQPP